MPVLGIEPQDSTALLADPLEGSPRWVAVIVSPITDDDDRGLLVQVLEMSFDKETKHPPIIGDGIETNLGVAKDLFERSFSLVIVEPPSHVHRFVDKDEAPHTLKTILKRVERRESEPRRSPH